MKMINRVMESHGLGSTKKRINLRIIDWRLMEITIKIGWKEVMAVILKKIEKTIKNFISKRLNRESDGQDEKYKKKFFLG